jgi:hypothetical protein
MLILFFVLAQKKGLLSSIIEKVKERSLVFLSMARELRMEIGILRVFLLLALKISS